MRHCTIFLFVKFIYFEKAAKFYEISIIYMSYVVPVKSKVEILQNFLAFSEYMNFKKKSLVSKLPNSVQRKETS